MKTKHMALSIAFAGVCIFIFVAVYFGVEIYSANTPDMSAIETIKANQISPGKFYRGETTVCVDSVEDLGFVRKSSGINLYYGKMLVVIPYRALDNEEYLTALSEIGIKIYTRVDENNETQYRLTYWDEDIVEWSRVG